MKMSKKTETWVLDSPLAEPEIVWTKRAYTVERYSDKYNIICRGINVKWIFTDGRWYTVKEDIWTPCDEPIYETMRNNESTLQARS